LDIDVWLMVLKRIYPDFRIAAGADDGKAHSK
jgi:hypothetical protein